MASPSLMFENAINPIKGWFQPAALDFSAKLSANVTIRVAGGRVVHLNAAGEFETGIGDAEMAIFTIQASDDYDVANDGTTPAGNFMHKAIAPTGVMSGLVATGAYELQTTEFDAAPNLAYAPNQLLTAVTANTTLASGGVLCNDRAGAGGSTGVVRQYTDAACGVVSRGQGTNEHGVAVLTVVVLAASE